MTNATFKVRANPVLHDSGELAGKLEYVRFTADCKKNGTHREWRTDASDIDRVLHALESSGMRYEVLNHLRTGSRIDLPGMYSDADLARLGFETAK